MGKKSRKRQKLTGQKSRMTGKQKARIWCAIITNLAPIIRALAALLVVLILIVSGFGTSFAYVSEHCSLVCRDIVRPMCPSIVRL